jgi:predicted GNAT family acetyltransferase
MLPAAVSAEGRDRVHGTAPLITFTLAPNAAAERDRVREALLGDEVANNLLLGILDEMADLEASPAATGRGPVLAVAGDDAGIRAVAAQVPPRNLVIACLAHPPEPGGGAPGPGGPGLTPVAFAALEALARGLAVRQLPLAGVFGPSPEAAAFAVTWRALTGQPARRAVAMQLCRATEIRPPSPAAPGRLRPGAAGDVGTVAGWLAAFNEEALGEVRADPAAAQRVATELVAPGRRQLSIWDDGGPVSMAVAGGFTAHGARIFAVYTPPERRRHGYASACVAEVSRQVLASGRRFACLFHDRANPTAAHIYREIGYEPVAAFDDYRFGA